MAAANAVIASLRVSLGLDSAQFTTGLRDASATMARESARQQKAADDLAKRLSSLKSSLDPVYAAQQRIGNQMKELASLYKSGAVAGADYGRMMGQLAGQLKAVSTAQAGAEKNTKALANAGLNLGRQFADVGVSIAGGINPLMVLIQQGPQIADAFQTAKQGGLGFGTVIKDLAGAAGRLVATWGPAIAVAAAAGGAFLIWKKNTEDLSKAMKAAAEVQQEFTAVQNSTRDALSSAAEFADKYKVANTLLTKSLDDVLISQNAAYAETLAGIDANDQAGRAAVRRAELERLLTVSILKRAAAEATARAGEAEAEAKKAKKLADRQGLFASVGQAYRGAEGGVIVDPISAAETATAKKAKELNIAATEKAAKQERDYAKALNASAAALMGATLVIPEVAKARTGLSAADKAAAKASREAAKAQEDFNDRLQDLLRSLETAGERTVREYAEATQLLRQGLDAGKISADQYREAIERLNPVVVDAKDAQKAFNGELKNTPADLAKAIKAIDNGAASALEDFERMRQGWDSVFYSIKDRDWAAAFRGLLEALKDVQQAFSETGTKADKVAAVGSLLDAAGNAIGGKGGRAISSASNAATTAFLATGNPVVAAAAAAVAGLAELLKSKPSNEGAGYSLVSGQFTGKSRSADTERAALAAANAIREGQKQLEASGLTLGATVHGLVIGTRDLSQVYLTNGQTVTAAVGDAAAAAEAGLKAMLESATYATEAQEKLVRSLLATGKGFDEISAALETYKAAQGISAGLADQILQINDPKAFDLESVRRSIDDQRKAYAQLAADGYLTAEQLATINGQLSTLEGLRLDEVLKRYGEAIETATETVDTTPDTLKAANAAAGQAVLDAYSTFAQVKQAEIDGLNQTADSLAAFRRELSIGSIAGRNPGAQLGATRSEFERLAGLAPTDPDRLANLQGVAQAFIAASRAASPDELTFRRDLAAVRRATESSQSAARSQAEVLQSQLDTQTSMLTQLGLLNSTTMDMASALKAYLATQDLLRSAGVANDNGFDPARYLALNPDLGQNWIEGGILRQAGPTLDEALLAHWQLQGKPEGRKFATGGTFRMPGPGGVDSKLAKFWMSPDETAVITKGDPMGGLAAEIRALRSDMGMLKMAQVQALGYQRRAESIFRKWDGDGLPAERDVA